MKFLPYTFAQVSAWGEPGQARFLPKLMFFFFTDDGYTRDRVSPFGWLQTLRAHLNSKNQAFFENYDFLKSGGLRRFVQGQLCKQIFTNPPKSFIKNLFGTFAQLDVVYNIIWSRAQFSKVHSPFRSNYQSL